MTNRIVITGIGAVTPLGPDMAASWDAFKKGGSGIGPISRFDAQGLPWKRAGEVRGFNPSEFLPEKETARLDTFIHFAVSAAALAVDDAGAANVLDDASVIIGSSRGGAAMVENAIIRRPTAFMMSGSTVGMGASFVAKRFGIRGGAMGISSACSSGASAIGEGMRLIKHGEAQVVLAGGAEAPITPLCVRGYGVSGALSKSGICRPFDRDRDGFVLSEGAAVLVLEELHGALDRGATVYAEVLGYGTSSDAHHQTVPDSAGQARAMLAALSDAGAEPSDVDCISAHATSTRVGDAVEAEAIRRVFGMRSPAVYALKSMTGHMLGASGALEAACAAMAVREGMILPTINLMHPDEDGLDFVMDLRNAETKAVLCNSFGFGGANSALLIGRYLEG